MSQPQAYLTVADIVQTARVSRQLVRNWVLAGFLRPVLAHVQVLVFEPAEVERWLDEWQRVRKRPFRRSATRQPIDGLDRPMSGFDCVLPPAIPRAQRRLRSVDSPDFARRRA